MTRQPYRYVRTELLEPDWRRLPGFRDVTEAEWRDAQWQRAHCVKNLKQLRAVVGDRWPETFFADVEADMARFATMPMLLPPQMLNTITGVAPARSSSAVNMRLRTTKCI